MVKWKAYKWVLSAACLWLLGCSATAPGNGDPLFPGYHSDGNSGGLTPVIVDRSRLRARERRPDPAPAQPRDEQADSILAGQYPSQSAFIDQYNLVHHLYGPDYYLPYGQRYWRQYRRQWSSLPWYGWAPGYNDWWYDPYWSWEYRWNSYAWDPWFDHFYDPWYWDPYSGYGSGYGYSYAGYYYNPNRHYWRRGSQLLAGENKKGAKQRRPRNRRGSLENLTGQTNGASLAGAGMPKSTGKGNSSSSSPKQKRGSVRKSDSNTTQATAKSTNSSSKSSDRKQARKRKRKN
ncbi:MAG: hypothetical protein V3W14_07875 [Candidatus Neomarinimicrobiota bacterium]